MKAATGSAFVDGNPRGKRYAPFGGRYSVVGRLRSIGRAELFVALPRFAESIEQVVVIKAYESAADAGGTDAQAELELASAPHHENLVRVLEWGWTLGGHFIVSEYLEGMSLRRLLRRLGGSGRRLPDAAAARILIGMLAAVEHAGGWARTRQARTLVRQPLEATNVFITFDGGVKVVGFGPLAQDAPSSPPSRLESAAIDDLLSTQRGPALRGVLARIGSLSSSTSLAGLSHVVRILEDWQRRELGTEGGAELAEVMAGVWPEERAARRTQVETALARVVRARDVACAGIPGRERPTKQTHEV